MNKPTLSLIAIGLVAGLAMNTYAITIGFDSLESPDRLLGTIDPSTPTSLSDEVGMINYLLTQTSDGSGVTDGHNNSGVITVANNPDDNGGELYTLWTGISGYGSSVPTAAPLAILGGATKDEANPPDNTFTLLSPYTWLVAKYGNNSEVYYIGDLSAGTPIDLAANSVRPIYQHDNDPTKYVSNGLSHISLYGSLTTTRQQVPDGGLTLAMLAMACVGITRLRKRLS